MYICVDFDGTVVDHRYPCVGDPVPLAIDWLHRWVELGAQLILFTMRADAPEKGLLQDAVDYFAENNIPFTVSTAIQTRIPGPQVPRPMENSISMIPLLAVRSSIRPPLTSLVWTGKLWVRLSKRYS